MAVKLSIDGAGLSPSPCADFRNAGRPVQSGCYLATHKIFIGIDSCSIATMNCHISFSIIRECVIYIQFDRMIDDVQTRI